VTLTRRAVIVHRRTELDELVARHGTRGGAEFFLRTRGQDIHGVQQRHDAVQMALGDVSASIPSDWRRGAVERADLNRFLFEPDDIVVVVGQDGLVANVAKYLDSQCVIGVNPEPAINPGVLVPVSVRACSRALARVDARDAEIELRTMVTASVDDGQSLTALNEIFIGHSSHQSARYRLSAPGSHPEHQSSSGLIISTGTGATGWCRSIWLERQSAIVLPKPWQPRLAWFVREAWPSPATGTTVTQGGLGPDDSLAVMAETDGLVLFGDGIETDRISLSWGQSVTTAVATRALHLVRPPADVLAA
jgi:hypothetical protein